MFDYFMESICLECVNGEDGCMPEASIKCPFSGEIEELAKLCESAEELAKNIAKRATEDYYTEREEAFRSGNW